MVSKSSRNLEADFIRALVMLVLPFTHCYVSTNETLQHIVDFIRVYQMPVLMFISGVFVKIEYNQMKSWLGKRGRRLLMPGIIWSILFFWKDILYSFNLQLIDYILTTVTWFLFVLFVFNVFIYLWSFLYCQTNKTVPFYFFCVIVAGALYCISLISNISFVSLLAWHWVFFSLGFMLKTMVEADSIKDASNYLTLLVFFLLTITLLVLTKNLEMNQSSFIRYILLIAVRYVDSIFGIIMIVIFANLVPRCLKSCCTFVSKSSMYIYLTHLVFIQMSFGVNPYIEMLVKWSLGVGVALLIAFMADKYNLKMVKFIYGG